MLKKCSLLAVLTAGIGTMAYVSVVHVPPGHKAILSHRDGAPCRGDVGGDGRPASVALLGPGWHLLYPFIRRAHVMRVTEHTQTFHCAAVETQDAQHLDVDLVVSFRPIDDNLAQIYANSGNSGDYGSKIVGPAADAVLRWVLSDYLSAEVVGPKQGEISWVLRDLLGARIEPQFVLPVSVQFGKLSFTGLSNQR